MTPAAMALLIGSCGLSLPPGITAERLATIAAVESGGRVDAVSPPNQNGTKDYGLLQLNSAHIGKPGFPRTVAEALQPCPNIAAGVRILAEADRLASCTYNAGARRCLNGFHNGYPEKIQAAAVRLARLNRASAPIRGPIPKPETWDVWVEAASPDAVPEFPEGEDDAAQSGDLPRVLVENP